jgi:hypothetical protein
MPFVKLAPDGTAFRYPYTVEELKADNPNVSFPSPLTEEDVLPFGVRDVLTTPPPNIDYFFNAYPKAVEGVNGWIEEWEIFPASQEEIDARIGSQEAGVRAERDRLLTESDWTQVPDAVNAGADIDAWADYRQQLRDVSKQQGFPWEVEWPEPPALVPPELRIDYRAFYNALLVSPAYAAIRSRALSSPPVLASCLEFVAAISDAKSGRPNQGAIQTCINLLCMAAQFGQPELAALAEVMQVGNVGLVYTLPDFDPEAP